MSTDKSQHQKTTTQREMEFLRISVESFSDIGLYRALLRIVRQNAQPNHVIGHDAIVGARTALAKASGRAGQAIDWAKEKMP